MRRTFTWAEHDEMGWGFIPDAMRGGWPAGNGQGVAHDVMEHQPGFGTENELMALGALWWGRGEQGYLSYGYRPAEENVASDVMNTWRDLSNRCADRDNDYRLRDLGRTQRLEYESTETALRGIIKQATELFIVEERFNRDEGEDVLDNMPPEFEERTFKWMKRGYRWAARTHRDADRMCQMFSRIEAKVEPMIAGGDVGERIVVSYDVPTLRLDVRWQPMDDYDRWR